MCVCIMYCNMLVYIFVYIIIYIDLSTFSSFRRSTMHHLESSPVHTAGVLGRFHPRTSPFPVEGVELVPDGRQRRFVASRALSTLWIDVTVSFFFSLSLFSSRIETKRRFSGRCRLRGHVTR